MSKSNATREGWERLVDRARAFAPLEITWKVEIDERSTWLDAKWSCSANGITTSASNGSSAFIALLDALEMRALCK